MFDLVLSEIILYRGYYLAMEVQTGLIAVGTIR